MRGSGGRARYQVQNACEILKFSSTLAEVADWSMLHPTRMSHLPAPRKGSFVARLSYLGRRGDGRYFLQIRLEKQAAKLFGLPSSVSGDFAEARRRLVTNLGWVQELIEALDLESLGAVIETRLTTYVARDVPEDERQLAERYAFEQEDRRYLTRAQ
jgi:hypothetical protein